jgi:hypothetical protein
MRRLGVGAKCAPIDEARMHDEMPLRAQLAGEQIERAAGLIGIDRESEVPEQAFELVLGAIAHLAAHGHKHRA